MMSACFIRRPIGKKASGRENSSLGDIAHVKESEVNVSLYPVLGFPI